MAKPEKRTAIDATGRTVAERVRQLRVQQNLTYAELSRRIQDDGRLIPVLGLSRIETLERRVDSDDLVALAAALGVSPITLLMPHTYSETDPVTVSGVTEPVAAERYWEWLTADFPLDQTRSHVEFRWRATPLWMHGQPRSSAR